MTKLASTALLLALTSAPAASQTFPTDDPVIRRMWSEGTTDGSQAYPLAQALLDSIGPRLMGSEGFDAAADWVIDRYEAWGISARREHYGTWLGWRRGHTRLDLIEPRYRGLEGIMLAYSAGTTGPVEGEVVLFPNLADSLAYERWLADVDGRFVMVSAPEPTCRPDVNWDARARPESVERMLEMRDSMRSAWASRFRNTGSNLGGRLDASGAAGILTTYWSAGWGVNKVHSTDLRSVPMLDVSCEDYGLLFRLAENGQGPHVRLDADSELLGERPAYNVIASMRGSELPDEYVLLSAHLDSWDGASGATDNGTATIMIMEAMRILKATFPNPRRTILVGHWGGEEQGLVGSTAFAADNPETVAGIHIGFNQDNGGWRIEAIRMQGFSEAQENVTRWLSSIPREIADTIQFDSPQREGSSDHTSFTCWGAPVVRLQANYPDYRQYTWHTNRDTFDKIVFDDLRNNATLTAMLAYLAADDSEPVSRVRQPPPSDPGQPQTWPPCRPSRRSATGEQPAA